LRPAWSRSASCCTRRDFQDEDDNEEQTMNMLTRIWKLWNARHGAGLNKRRRGMSLIEIMVAVTILAMMTAGVAMFLIPKINEAKIKRAVMDMSAIENSLKLYYAKKGKFPDTGVGLKALVDSQELEKMPKDPWNNDYVYMLEANKPVIVSYGADGQSGGDGDSADISSKAPPQ
jgi:general secretion pathway protein G